MSATEDPINEPGRPSDGSDWEFDPVAVEAEGETLVVDVEGFEGPLDLLLAMARTQ
jgi:segregation and condensation protein A